MGDDAYVESVLEELIQRFSKSPRKTDVRAALIEAKRLKSIAANWLSVAPSPDSRAAFMERMSALLATAEAEAPPGSPGITPPRGFSGAKSSRTSAARIEGLSRTVSTIAMARQKQAGHALGPAPPTKRTQQFPPSNFAPLDSPLPPSPDEQSSSLEWRAHRDVPGIELMILDQDRVDTRAALVRMKSGSDIPREKNSSQLTLIVLAGGLQVGSKQLAVGDTRKLTSETATGRVFTRAGCTLAVVGSADDGLFAVARASP